MTPLMTAAGADVDANSRETQSPRMSTDSFQASATMSPVGATPQRGPVWQQPLPSQSLLLIRNIYQSKLGEQHPLHSQLPWPHIVEGRATQLGSSVRWALALRCVRVSRATRGTRCLVPCHHALGAQQWAPVCEGRCQVRAAPCGLRSDLTFSPWGHCYGTLAFDCVSVSM